MHLHQSGLDRIPQPAFINDTGSKEIDKNTSLSLLNTTCRLDSSSYPSELVHHCHSNGSNRCFGDSHLTQPLSTAQDDSKQDVQSIESRCSGSHLSACCLADSSSSTKQFPIDSSYSTPRPTCAPAPFSHDLLAQEANAECDYSIKITTEMAMAGLAPRPIRVYADGAYDMFHSGHARQLMQAKCTFPNTYLIVGVSNDADVHRFKGRTVMNEAERYEAVRHCRYVDEVVTDAPWAITPEFITKHKIDFVAHDDIPYASASSDDIYKPLKDAGMFLATQRTEGISTTDVIGRIVRDYDVYLRRNLRRGLSRKDLNISYMKEKKLKFQNNFETIMKHGSNLIQNFDNKRRELVDHLEDMSQEVVRSFMRIFGSDGRLRNWFHSRRFALTDTEDERTSPEAGSTSEPPDDSDSCGLSTNSGVDADSAFFEPLDSPGKSSEGGIANKHKRAMTTRSSFVKREAEHNEPDAHDSSPPRQTKSRRTTSVPPNDKSASVDNSSIRIRKRSPLNKYRNSTNRRNRT